MRRKYTISWLVLLITVMATGSTNASSVFRATLNLNIVVFKKAELPIVAANGFACDAYAYASGSDYSLLPSGVYNDGNKDFAIYQSCYMPFARTTMLENGQVAGVFLAAQTPRTEFTIALPPSDFKIIAQTP